MVPVFIFCGFRQQNGALVLMCGSSAGLWVGFGFGSFALSEFSKLEDGGIICFQKPLKVENTETCPCHCVALDVNGRCYTWGRNDKGQLGHGDQIQRDQPTVVSALASYKIVKAGSGRSHTVVVTEDGLSLAFGWNKHGQLGTGSIKNGDLMKVDSIVILRNTKNDMTLAMDKWGLVEVTKPTSFNVKKTAVMCSCYVGFWEPRVQLLLPSY